MLPKLETFYIREDWNDLKTQIIAGLSFWTRMPLPFVAPQVPTSDSLARTTPIIALGFGLVLALLVVLLSILHVPYGVAAALILVAGLVLTGGLHEDGLANCADSIGGKTITHRLEIVKDSRLGTFGVLALALSLLVRWQATSELLFEGTFVAIGSLVAAAIISRIGAMVPFALLKAADMPDAVDTRMSGPYFYVMLVGGFVLASLFFAPALNLPAFILVAAAIAGGLALVIAWAQKSYGGTVRDLRGATQQLLEIITLVGAVVFGA